MPGTTDIISIFIPSLRGGGAERVMVTLANGFAGQGHRVDLVLARAEGPYLADVSARVRVVDLGASRVLTSLPGLVRYLRREKPNAMLSALNHANVAAIAARMLAGVPTRLVVSERNHVTRSMQASRDLASRAVIRLMAWLYPHADGIVAISDGVADDLARAAGLPLDSITVVYNPAVTPVVEALAGASPPEKYLAAGSLPVILGVGRLTAQKDFSTLIRAFARVRSCTPCRLVILGEGELRDELKALADSLGLDGDVSMPGFVDNPYACMSRAAVFVLSSRWEGFGNVIAEAMACGCPVVSTDCPSGPAEILEGGRWGRLVPVGDADALAEAMLATLSEERHPDVARRAGDFGVDQALAKYSDMLGLKTPGPECPRHRACHG